MKKKALITGITGQDGSYLAEILLEKGYEVHGIIRRASTFNTSRIDHLMSNPDILNHSLFLHHGDVVDTSNLNRVLEKVGPDEIYNLAAQSHVKVSFDVPDYTGQVDALGTLRFLDAIREVGLRKVKFYQASTSELYGKVQEIPQSETTPFYPRSPYAVAKLYAYWIIVNYREAYDIFASNGILFNHESPRRGETFVTRKITRAAVRILFGLEDVLSLGNLNSKRDWGYAPEYCEGMWRIVNYEKPDDFVLATGVTKTVREFTELCFNTLGVRLEWKGSGAEEKGILADFDSDSHQKIISAGGFANPHGLKLSSSLVKGKTVVIVNPRYYRPTEVDLLIGNPSKAERILGWKAETQFEELVSVMTAADLQIMLKNGA